jgi:uncharacterized membrane protein
MTIGLRNIKPEKAFLIIALVFGMTFLVSTPPFQVFDESEHFYKAIYLGEGHVLPVNEGYGAGIYVPQSAFESIRTFQNLPLHPENKVDLRDIKSLLKVHFNEKYKVFMDMSGKSIITYSPVPYLASAVFIDVAKLLNPSPLILMYLGRLANLLVWILLIYKAIKIIPVHKWVLMFLALMPMTIFQGASLSADSFTIGLSFLLVAFILKLRFDEDLITKRDIYILFLLSLMLALSKPVYVVLMALIFIVPASRFENKKKMFLTFTLLFGLVLTAATIWNILASGFYVSFQPQVSVQGQTEFILTEPFTALSAILNSLALNWKDYLLMFVGNLGWGDTPLPFSLICIYVFMLILTAILDKSEVKIKFKDKLVFSLVFLSLFTSIFVLEYLTWTPVGKTVVDGVHGRYFIPIAPLLLLLFYNKQFDYDIEKGFNVIIITFILITLSIALLEIIKRFYIG